MRTYKDIPGFEGHYQINRLGEVRSLDRVTCDGRHIRGKQLNTYLKSYNGFQYVGVTLRKDGITKSAYPHVLLKEMFNIDISPQDFVEDWKCRKWLRGLDIELRTTDEEWNQLDEEAKEVSDREISTMDRFKHGLTYVAVAVITVMIMLFLD